MIKRTKRTLLAGSFALAFTAGVTGCNGFSATASTPSMQPSTTLVSPAYVPSTGQEQAATRRAAVWAEQPGWLWSLSRCIRNHESINVGHYQAENPVSTAAGAYQYIQSTWDGNARWAKWNGRYVARKYVGKPASHAPAWVQDVVFIHTISRGGIKAWNGTGCPGT